MNPERDAAFQAEGGGYRARSRAAHPGGQSDAPDGTFPLPIDLYLDLARRAKSLLECAAMLTAFKRLALVMVMVALPLQGLAAVVIPVCQSDPAQESSAAKSEHRHADKHDHDHGAPAPDHDHPIAASDFGSDHCGAGLAFAIPVMATKPPAAPGSEHSVFLATSISEHIPEQPRRPPRAALF